MRLLLVQHFHQTIHRSPWAENLPLCEGDGRTQRAFLAQLIRSAGHDLNWSEVDGDLLMIATIQAAQGVTDLLRQVLGEAIK